jgi:hypothetical protein
MILWILGRLFNKDEMGLVDKPSNFDKGDYRSRNYSGNWSKHFINEYFDTIEKIGQDEANIELYDSKKEHLPKSLFKFFPPSTYSLLSIENQTIYLSVPQNFNDPFDSFLRSEEDTYIKSNLLKEIRKLNILSDTECSSKLTRDEYYAIQNSNTHYKYNPRYKKQGDRFDSVINNLITRKENPIRSQLRELVRRIAHTYTDKIKVLNANSIGISCFSTFSNEKELLENVTMWSHYADHHRGFCVEYDTSRENIKNREEIICSLFPVTYTSKVPILSVSNLTKIDLDSEYVEINKALMKSIYKTYMTKSRFWSYEKEWRLIMDLNVSPFIINRTIPFFPISKIYLGCRIEYNLKKHIINFAINNDIEVFETNQSRENFNLYTTTCNKDTVSSEDDNIILKNINKIKNKKIRFKKKGQYYKMSKE